MDLPALPEAERRAIFLAQDAGVDLPARDEARTAARAFFLLSLVEGRKSLLEPMLVAVGGVIASGKSTISGAE